MEKQGLFHLDMRVKKKGIYIMQEKIVRYTSEELDAMSHLSLTDWKARKNMTDDDIDFSEIPEPTDEQLAKARWHNLEKKAKEQEIKEALKDSLSKILPKKTVAKIKSHKSWKSMLKKEIEKLVANGVF